MGNMQGVFDVQEKKKITVIVGFFILVLGLWQLYQTLKVREILNSSRTVMGEVLESPECSISSRRSQYCSLRIDSFHVLAKVEIIRSICDTITIGDKIALKYSSDKSNFYIKDDFYLKSNSLTIVFYVGILLIGILFIVYGRASFRIIFKRVIK